MNSWSIGKRLVGGFATVIAVAITLSAFFYTQLGEVTRNAFEISRNSLPSVYLIGALKAEAQGLYILAM